MKWINDSDKTEVDFIRQHIAHMGETEEVVNYLKMRHRKIMGNTTYNEVHDAYLKIPQSLKDQWQATRSASWAAPPPNPTTSSRKKSTLTGTSHA